MTPLTRDEAREQVARALYVAPRVNPADAAERWDALRAGDDTRADYLDDAAAALSVLWPEVERLRDERDAAVMNTCRLAGDITCLTADIGRLRAELAHAHAVIARHVEPLRKPCRPEAGDCCDGDAHTWQPSAASMLPDCGPAGAPVDDQGSGRVQTRGEEDHG